MQKLSAERAGYQAMLGKVMKKTCVYCGNPEPTEKDHVPPACFFPKPRPSDLITVPSCSKCNRSLGIDDERVRNLLTSLSSTEQHPAVVSQLAAKRDRSLSRKRGAGTFQHLVESMRLVDLRTPQGRYLGQSYAFELDQETMNRFISRMTRALLYRENSIGWVNCKVDWKIFSGSEAWNDLCKANPWLSAPQCHRSIGGDVFSYVGYFVPNSATSLWFLNFFGNVEFKSIVRVSS